MINKIKRLYILIRSNFAKNKSRLLVFLFITLICSTLISLGAELKIGFKSFIESKFVKYDSSDIIMIAHGVSDGYSSGRIGKNKLKRKLLSDDVTESVDSIEYIESVAEYEDFGAWEERAISIVDINELRALGHDRFEIVEKSDSDIPEGEGIYLPAYMKYTGHNVGEDFEFTLKERGNDPKETDYSYKIAGFYEMPLFDSPAIDIVTMLIVPDEIYKEIKDDIGSDHGRYSSVFYITLKEKNTDTELLTTRFNKMFSDNGVSSGSCSRDNYVMICTFYPSFTSVFFLVVAVIAALIMMIMTGFRISTEIEENLAEYGSLKGGGMKSTEIRASIILTFIIITLAAAVPGIIAGWLITPGVSDIFAFHSGQIWKPEFDLSLSLTILLLLLASVLIISVLTTIRIAVISPLSAIREGIAAHNFRRNPFPLDKTKGGLNYLLALKLYSINMKQNMLLIISCILIGLIGSVATVYGYNLAASPSDLIRCIAPGSPDMSFTMKKEGGNDSPVKRYLESLDNVHCVEFQLHRLECSDYEVYARSFDDIDNARLSILNEGRFPKHANEVAINVIFSDALRVGVGDTIELKKDKKSMGYIVTGIYQDTIVDKCIYITQRGMDRLGDFDGLRSQNNVYIDYESMGIEMYSPEMFKLSGELEDDLRSRFGDKIDISDCMASAEQETKVEIVAFKTIAILIMAILGTLSAAIIVLIAKTVMISRRRYFGILSAGGFPSKMLRKQLALSFIPNVIIGTILGAVPGTIFGADVVARLLRYVGVAKLNMRTCWWMPVADVIFFSLICFAAAYIISSKLKKLSVYELVSE